MEIKTSGSKKKLSIQEFSKTANSFSSAEFTEIIRHNLDEINNSFSHSIFSTEDKTPTITVVSETDNESLFEIIRNIETRFIKQIRIEPEHQDIATNFRVTIEIFNGSIEFIAPWNVSTEKKSNKIAQNVFLPIYILKLSSKSYVGKIRLSLEDSAFDTLYKLSGQLSSMHENRERCLNILRQAQTKRSEEDYLSLYQRLN